jgi:hypothetical protein
MSLPSGWCFADTSNGHAVLPVFIFGLVMSRYYQEQRARWLGESGGEGDRGGDVAAVEGKQERSVASPQASVPGRPRRPAIPLPAKRRNVVRKQAGNDTRPIPLAAKRRNAVRQPHEHRNLCRLSAKTRQRRFLDTRRTERPLAAGAVGDLARVLYSSGSPNRSAVQRRIV